MRVVHCHLIYTIQISMPFPDIIFGTCMKNRINAKWLQHVLAYLKKTRLQLYTYNIKDSGK